MASSSILSLVSRRLRSRNPMVAGSELFEFITRLNLHRVQSFNQCKICVIPHKALRGVAWLTVCGVDGLLWIGELWRKCWGSSGGCAVDGVLWRGSRVRVVVGVAV